MTLIPDGDLGKEVALLKRQMRTLIDGLIDTATDCATMRLEPEDESKSKMRGEAAKVGLFYGLNLNDALRSRVASDAIAWELSSSYGIAATAAFLGIRAPSVKAKCERHRARIDKTLRKIGD